MPRIDLKGAVVLSQGFIRMSRIEVGCAQIRDYAQIITIVFEGLQIITNSFFISTGIVVLVGKICMMAELLGEAATVCFKVSNSASVVNGG